MTWRSIERAVDLPKKGTHETNTLDFKGEPTDDAIEIGKDVAAFANAQGGTLLIGAYGGCCLEHYKALTAAAARLAAVTYDDAVKVRCAPAPLFSIDLIDKDGGFVVAVNVQPFPAKSLVFG